MTFVSQQLVRFAHVDGAGIVFYPRYFEMLNAAVEDYFAAAGVSFGVMHGERRLGVPTVKLDVEFVAASRLGDVLDFRLVVERVGERSATLAVAVDCAGERRFAGRVVLVCTDLDRMRSVPWPDDMRPRLDEQDAAGAPSAD